MMSAVLPWFQFGNAAVNLGRARSALQLAVAHATGRKYEHSASSLADVPSIRGLLADMSFTLEPALAYLRQTAAMVAAGDPGAMLHVLQIKPVANLAAQEIVCKAMRVCGGAAFAAHLPVERLFRDAQAGCLMAPTVDLLGDFVGKALVGQPLF